MTTDRTLTRALLVPAATWESLRGASLRELIDAGACVVHVPWAARRVVVGGMPVFVVNAADGDRDEVAA